MEPTIYQRRKELLEEKNIRRREEGQNSGESGNMENIAVIDSGGGQNSTITSRAWRVFERTNHQQDIRGYGEKGMKTCDIVNATTKAWIPGSKEPILLVVNQNSGHGWAKI